MKNLFGRSKNMEVHHNSVLECDSTTATKNPTKIDAKNDSPNASAAWEKASDKHCTCSLKLGISEEFLQRNCNKPGKHNVKIDVIDSIFSDGDQKRILDKRSNGMETYYKDVLSGKRETLTLYPDGFQFDKRVETYHSAVLDQLDQMKDSLGKEKEGDISINGLIQVLKEKKQGEKFCGQIIRNVIETSKDLPSEVKIDLCSHFENKSFYHQNDLSQKFNRTIIENQLKAMKKFIQTVKPQQAESEIINQLSSLFFNHRGLLLHSLKLDSFLQIFTDEAKRYRKRKNPGFELTKLEHQIANALNLTETELEETANQVVNILIEASVEKQNSVFSRNQIYNAIGLCQSWHEDLKVRAKRKFDGQAKYKLNDIKNAIKLSRYEHESKYPGEVDVLTILPDLELIMQVEVKCDLKDNTAEKNNFNLKSAAKQLQRYSNHISRVHGPVLNENWKYLKVAAILPSVGNIERVCSHCKRFIVTHDVLKQKGLPIWWKEFELPEKSLMTNSSTDQFYSEFLHLFNRLVNLTAISRQKSVFTAWKEVQGENRNNIVAGITPPENSNASTFRFQDIIKRPMDVWKLLYFNPEQMFLLSTKGLNRVVLFADYGCGKTLVCKEKALRKSLENNGEKVYYISLVSATSYGFPYRTRHIFDICTKEYDFKDTDVIALDVQDLMEEYKKSENLPPDYNLIGLVSVYELVLNFIKNNPDAHFILDEVPLCKDPRAVQYNSNSTQKFQDFILECSKVLEDSKLLWISVQSNAMSDFVEARSGFEIHLKNSKTILQENGFHFPVLSSNMRNSRQISQSKLTRKGNIKQASHLTATSSSVNGKLPMVIPIRRTAYPPNCEDSLESFSDFYRAIKRAMDHADVENGNWVIMHDRDFSSTKIKKQLEMHTDKKIRCYPSECGQEDINDIKEFIEFDRNTILLVERSLFLGCESRNVICMTYDRFGSGEHLRGSLLRAVENLCLIYAFDDGFVYSDVSGFKVDGSFLVCGKLLKVAEHWACKTCKQTFLCTSCKLICHQGHDLQLKHGLSTEFDADEFRNSKNKFTYHDCSCNELNMCKLSNKQISS